MKNDHKKIMNLFIRYIILILIAIPGMDLFYFVLLPLTKWPVFWVLDIFYSPILLKDTIFIGTKIIEIVGACVAGSAYYFLLILNLATPNIERIKRLKIIFISFGIFLLINVVRIILLSFMYVEGSPIFDVTHKVFWYLGSTLFVVAIWFFQVYKYKIISIPFFSDLKFLYSLSSFKRSRD